jgi:hypothetical protein
LFVVCFLLRLFRPSRGSIQSAPDKLVLIVVLFRWRKSRAVEGKAEILTCLCPTSARQEAES